MALIPCVNCGWMCNETDTVCNMCGQLARVRGAPPPPSYVMCAFCGWPTATLPVFCGHCNRPWQSAVQPSPWVPPPVGISSTTRPDPSMLTREPPPPPHAIGIHPGSPVPSPQRRVLPNRPMPDAEITSDMTFACIDCSTNVGGRPARCPQCGLAPDQDSVYSKAMADRIRRAITRCDAVKVWTTQDGARSEAIWVADRRLLDVLGDCLQIDCGRSALKDIRTLAAGMEIREPEGILALSFDAELGRVVGHPANVYFPLREPRRIFRWLTWVGLTGLEQYTE